MYHASRLNGHHDDLGSYEVITCKTAQSFFNFFNFLNPNQCTVTAQWKNMCISVSVSVW